MKPVKHLIAHGDAYGLGIPLSLLEEGTVEITMVHYLVHYEIQNRVAVLLGRRAP